MCFVHCLCITGPAMFDYNKRLIQLTVIPLSGGQCSGFLDKHSRLFVSGCYFRIDCAFLTEPPLQNQVISLSKLKQRKRTYWNSSFLSWQVLNALISLYMCTCGSLAQRRTYRRAATRDWVRENEWSLYCQRSLLYFYASTDRNYLQKTTKNS